MSTPQVTVRKPFFPRLAVAAAFALGLAVPAAWAHGHHHHEYHHHHHHGYEIRPHNAAIHLLMMAPAIGLSHEQVEKLMKMRDDYIKNNAVAEDMLKVEHMDLKWLLYADDFNKEAAEKKLGEIGKLEGQLWDAYVDQRAKISALLTPKQKDKLKEMYHHHKMDMDHDHGDMDEHHDHGDMDEHGDHGGSMMNNMED
ncbi:MAG TPA: periplasmic heavy metal sensor [Pseudodesulfovibrio sp.]|nr:periplasmic heavy metal sensor [Pseudodesulfovibrio sp.]